MKKFASLCAAALLVGTLALSGCHGRREQAAFAVPESFDTSRQYEVVFWAKNDTNKTQTDIYKQAIEDFQQLYPNITVTMRLYTNYGDIYNDVITNISTGTTPNVCITYPDHIATYLTGDNVVVPLDELFADERYGLGGSELLYEGPTQEEIVPQFLDECRLGGTYYAIPYMRSTEACYINKDFVEALGYEVPDVLIQPFRAGEHIALHTADGVLIAACVCFRQSLLLIGNAILVEGQIGGIIAVAPHLVVAFDRGTKKRYHLVDIICQVFVGKYALAQLTVAANYAFDKIFACHQPSVPAAVGQQEAAAGKVDEEIIQHVVIVPHRPHVQRAADIAVEIGGAGERIVHCKELLQNVVIDKGVHIQFALIIISTSHHIGGIQAALNAADIPLDIADHIFREVLFLWI